MARRPNFLNVRAHLEYVALIVDCYQKYGACPLLDQEMRSLSLFNRAILKKHDAARKAGNRKDLYIEAKS